MTEPGRAPLLVDEVGYMRFGLEAANMFFQPPPGGCSYGSSSRLVRVFGGTQQVEELTGDHALEAADDLFLGQALLRAAVDVGTGAGVPAHPGESEAVQGGVGLSVAAAVESVAVGLAGGGRDR